MPGRRQLAPAERNGRAYRKILYYIAPRMHNIEIALEEPSFLQRVHVVASLLPSFFGPAEQLCTTVPVSVFAWLLFCCLADGAS